jgi:hypothetical protein
MSEWLLPPVVPRVLIQTSTNVAGAAEVFRGMTLWPGRNGVGGLSSAVSLGFAGVALGDDRICATVPVLSRSMVTALSLVGPGSCNINPTPSLNLGKGWASKYVSVDHAVAGSPSIAIPAESGLSAEPPGEKTEALSGFTVPAGPTDGVAARGDGEADIGDVV